MIKRLSINDLEAVKELFLEVFTNSPWYDKWESDAYVTLYMKDLMDQKNSMSLGFYVDERLVGISLGTTYHWWQGFDYFIKEFCIKTNLQGHGYGTMFLSEMESYLRDQGIKAMYLMTDRDIPAFYFYEKNHFHEVKNSVMFAKNIKDKE